PAPPLRTAMLSASLDLLPRPAPRPGTAEGVGVAVTLSAGRSEAERAPRALGRKALRDDGGCEGRARRRREPQLRKGMRRRPERRAGWPGDGRVPAELRSIEVDPADWRANTALKRRRAGATQRSGGHGGHVE